MIKIAEYEATKVLIKITPGKHLSETVENSIHESSWWRVYHWLRKKHPRVPVRRLKDRLFSDWVFREGGRELFRPSRVLVERYQFKGSKILHRWNQHLGVTDRLKHRELAFDDKAFLETISDLL